MRQAKGLPEAGHVIFSKWNSFSRVTVWGSLADPSVLVMIDADAGTLVLEGAGDHDATPGWPRAWSLSPTTFAPGPACS